MTQPADGGPPAAANAQHRVAKKGRAALHLAVASENLEVVELLLQRGANVNLPVMNLLVVFLFLIRRLFFLPGIGMCRGGLLKNTGVGWFFFPLRILGSKTPR